MRSTLLVSGLVVCVALAGFGADALAAKRTVTFKNTTGKKVNDLHIKTVEGVTIDSMTPFQDDNGVDGGNSHDLSNGTVDTMGTATVKMSSGSPSIKIKEWWWTLDGKQVGPTGKDGRGVLMVAARKMAGDGRISVHVAGKLLTFRTARNADADQAMRDFIAQAQAFVGDDGEPLLAVTQEDAYTVSLASEVTTPPADAGDDASADLVSIDTQDSGGSWTYTPDAPNTPTAIDGHAPSMVTGLRLEKSPARGAAVIQYTTSRYTPVELRIADAAGRLVWRESAAGSPGAHAVLWDGRGLHGGAVPAGVYRVELRADGGVLTRAFTFLR